MWKELLEKVFLCQARSINDKIKAVQLRSHLKKEDGSSFDSKLCSELVNHLGYGGLVNIEDFDQIWTLFRKRIILFEQLSRGESVLTPDAFQTILENVACQKYRHGFSNELLDFTTKRFHMMLLFIPCIISEKFSTI